MVPVAVHRGPATTAVLLLAVFPYSIFLYGPVYADALFLAGVLASFVLLERERVLAATMVCAIDERGAAGGLHRGLRARCCG